MMGGWRLAWFDQDFKEGTEIYSHPRNRSMTIFFLFNELPPPPPLAPPLPPKSPESVVGIPSPLKTHCCELLHP